ncbi:MAG: HEAT repeat domain-containing protein [Anaerolineae bacterium]
MNTLFRRIGLMLAVLFGLFLLLELGGGLLALGFFGFAGANLFLWFISGAILYLLFIGGGAGYHWVRVRQGKPSSPTRMPGAIWFAVAFLAVLALGHLHLLGEAVPVSFGLFFLLGAAIPPLATVAVGIQRLAIPVSWRQFAVGLVSGSILSVNLALLLEALLPALLFALVIPLRDVIAGLLQSDTLEELFFSRGFVLILVQLAVVAPLAEELSKPLGVVLLGRRLTSARQAFMVGMVGGAGFAIVENMLYEGYTIYWTGVTALRGIGGVLHPLTAGLVALGIYGVMRKEPGGRRRLLGYYGMAVGLHALWNGGLAVLYSSFGAYFFGTDTWTFNIYGVGLPGAVLVLMILEILFMWRILLTITARLREPGAREPETLLALRLHEPRRLALWASALLVIFVPVAALWDPLLGRHLSQMLPVPYSNYTQAIEVTPEDAKVYFDREAGLENQAEYDQAISVYTEVIEINPQFAAAHDSRGFAYLLTGEYDQAVTDFNQVIEFNPSDARAYNNRGVAYSEKGEYDRAIADFNKAIELDSQYAEAYFTLAVVYEETGRISEATEAYKTYIAYTLPQDPNIERAKQKIRALEEYKEAQAQEIDELIETLKDQDPFMRIGATEALGRIGPAARDAVPALIEALQDANRRVRAAAADALAMIGPVTLDVVPALIEALQDADEDVRIWAAVALGNIAPDVYDTPLLNYDSQPKEIITADQRQLRIDYYALWRITDPKRFVERFPPQGNLRQAQSRLDDVVFANIRDVLAKHTFAEIISVKRLEFLAEVTQLTDVQVRDFGMQVIGVQVERANLPREQDQDVFLFSTPDEFIEALRDADENMRLAAVEALAQLGSTAVPALTEALQDEDEHVRKAAAEALEKIRGE